MKHIFTALRTDVTAISFFPLKLYPLAYWFEKRVNDGPVLMRGAMPRSIVESVPTSQLVSFMESRGEAETDQEKSLPRNAFFWPVLRTKLANPNAELWPDYEKPLGLKEADDPAYVLLHKSGYDHQVWGVDRKPLMAPLRLRIYGSMYNLRRLGEHLESKFPQHFSDFDVEPNPTWQNHESQGRSFGVITFDPTGFEFPKKSYRSISSCEELFFRLAVYPEQADPFEVRQFATKSAAKH